MIIPENLPQNKIVEIELTFLVNAIPAETLYSEPVEYIDRYLSNDIDLLTKLRLRQKGNEFELTKKIVLDSTDASVQSEYMIPLSEAEYLMLKGLGGRELRKDRYIIELQNRQAGVDVFKGPLKGLVTVEFEFESIEAQNEFIPPVICIADVTQENFISGSYLAGKKYEDLAIDLSARGYTPI